MNNFKYFCRMLSGARFSKLMNVVDQVNHRTNKNKLFILFDIITCAALYGAGYNDYIIFGFYDMNAKQRKTYVTRTSNKQIIMQLNDQDYSYIFDEKNVFNKRFASYLKRDFLDLSEINKDDFIKFMENKDTVILKPNTAESGKGIEKLNKADFTDLQAMYEYIKDPQKHFGVAEELIIQHPDMSKLYPLSVNTMRIVTIVPNDGKARCVYAVCKMGNEGKFVDNMENSGLACPIDQETGKISGVAHTSKLINYSTHPYTGVKLVDYQLPYVKEAIEMCLQAALEVPQIRYVGWDVCITENGPAIIEGNDFPGYDFYQLPEHTPDKIGLLPYYKALLT